MKDKLLEFIKEDILYDEEATLTCEDELLRTDVLDSLGVMRLVEFIHHELGESIPAQDITVNNFSSVDAICAYLAAR